MEEPGIYYLAGLNGSGKSSVLKAIYGLLFRSPEIVKVHGRFVKKNQRQKYIAYLPQRGMLPKDTGVSDLIQVLKLDPAYTTLSADPFIQSLENTRIKRLSFGERRYLETMIVLSSKPDIVFLDEPFVGIEPVHVEKLVQYIVDLESRKVILIAGHSHHVVRQIAQRIFIIFNKTIREVKNELDELSRFGYLK
jgi:ABC-type multidrug transport system ATPase subunit